MVKVPLLALVQANVGLPILLNSGELLFPVHPDRIISPPTVLTTLSYLGCYLKQIRAFAMK
jgi:hypothetical protein